MNAKLIGPLTGVLFVVLVIVAFAVGGTTPGVGDPTKKIVSFYVDNGSDQQFAATLLALACVAFLFFLGALRQSLRATAGDEGGLSNVAILGGLMIAVGLSLFAGIGFTLGDAADDLPASSILTLNALNSDLFFTSAVGTAVFDLGLALAVLRHGGLPRALGWLALVIGIIALTPAGFFAFLATGIVVVWASVALTTQANAPEASAATSR